jgi:hypothetical protein
MAMAAAVPLATAVFMRILVYAGLIHGRVAEQSQVEHLITQFMGIVLIAAPWLTTAAAILYRSNRKVQDGALA